MENLTVLIANSYIISNEYKITSAILNNNVLLVVIKKKFGMYYTVELL